MTSTSNRPVGPGGPFRVWDAATGRVSAIIYGDGRWPSWSLWTPPGIPLFDWTPEPEPELSEAERAEAFWYAHYTRSF